MIAAYVTGALTLGGVALPPSRPVTDPPCGLDIDRIGETVYGVRRGEEESDKAYRARCIAAFYGPVPTVRSWIAEVAEAARGMAEACAQAGRPRRPFRERWEPLLAAILEAAPREARDGFNRRQGKAWDAFLVELAWLREGVTCGRLVEPATATLWAEVAWTRAWSKGAR